MDKFAEREKTPTGRIWSYRNWEAHQASWAGRWRRLKQAGLWRWAWRSAGPPRQIEAVQGVVNALVAGTQEAARTQQRKLGGAPR